MRGGAPGTPGRRRPDRVAPAAPRSGATGSAATPCHTQPGRLGVRTRLPCLQPAQSWRADRLDAHLLDFARGEERRLCGAHEALEILGTAMPVLLAVSPGHLIGHD